MIRFPLLALLCCACVWALEPLKVGPGGHYLVTASGKPFFPIGDSTWWITRTTSREEASEYLADARRRGFNMISVAVANRIDDGHRNAANVYGDKPFHDDDAAKPRVTPGNNPSQPGEYDYWDHLDFILEEARKHAQYVFFYPFWCSHQWGSDESTFRVLNRANAFEYGKWLGARYAKSPHLIWTLGGDNFPDSEEKRAVWRDLARGIAVAANDGRSPDYGRYFATYHPFHGPAASHWFHAEPWLDLDSFQSFMQRETCYTSAAEAYSRKDPARPVINIEPNYESRDGQASYEGRTVDASPLFLRRQYYQTFLAGAYPVFGNNDLKMFVREWRSLLDSAGRREYLIYAKLVASLTWWDLAPDQSLLVSGENREVLRQPPYVANFTMKVAARARSGEWAMVYFPDRSEATVRLPAAKQIWTAAWIRTTDGLVSPAGRIRGQETLRFLPPEGWADAVLLFKRQ